ncbi:uncharacterized protein TRAVEDRAFT_51792 [Trametes versicolor FP-101664 SS1]|uniref:uncharacterized protein n=1 Tax=Trametes versicolor (strain FP-101664) TaxID=717944 RepID=UPI0004621A7C|nr:uncharacterized protein TRAVEDRAFT_51792 [Trametes versicolor FP-101664 SS1]EIW54062.1 hypothetical protein TRAVEDRAFT_51792 [Trametes versicolor FP-101664 SS1]
MPSRSIKWHIAQTNGKQFVTDGFYAMMDANTSQKYWLGGRITVTVPYRNPRAQPATLLTPSMDNRAARFGELQKAL